MHIIISRKSVLIVDDSPIIAQRLQDILLGSENISSVRQANDYSSALRQLAEVRPDIVLLDINLPGKSGIALLQYIKKVYPSTFVIMITNKADDYYRKICLQMGADHFMDKSTDFEHLPVIISSFH
jgi:DNA-binding NarL/FixJ family response regulator